MSRNLISRFNVSKKNSVLIDQPYIRRRISDMTDPLFNNQQIKLPNDYSIQDSRIFNSNRGSSNQQNKHALMIY